MPLTMTVGNACALVGLVNANVTVLEVPWVVPPFAAVITRVPVDCVHAPAVPKRFGVDEIVKLPSAVWVPVRPVMVTVLPSFMSKFEVRTTWIGMIMRVKVHV